MSIKTFEQSLIKTGKLFDLIFVCFRAIVAALPAASSEGGGGQHNSGTTEFLMLGLPVLLCLTCASEHSHLVLAATAGVALSLGLAARRFCTVGRYDLLVSNFQQLAW